MAVARYVSLTPRTRCTSRLPRAVSSTATVPSRPPASFAVLRPTWRPSAYAVTVQDVNRPASRRQPTWTRPRLMVPTLATTSVALRASGAGVGVVPPPAVPGVVAGVSGPATV